jgi:hypothetical protein
MEWDVQFHKSSTNSYKDLYISNQEVLIYCYKINLPINVEEKCTLIELKFTDKEVDNLDVSGIVVHPQLNKAIIGFYYDDGGISKRGKDTIYGYIYVNIKDKTSQFRDLGVYQASDIVFLSTNNYILFQNERKTVLNRRASEIFISPSRIKQSYDLKIHAFSQIPNADTKVLPSFVIDCTVSTLNGDYDMVKLDNILRVTVYNEGWYDFGVNNKIVQGNNVKYEESLKDH